MMIRCRNTTAYSRGRCSTEEQRSLFLFFLFFYENVRDERLEREKLFL
jgi:hypothetical protein